MDGGENLNNTYQCCFCGKKIESGISSVTSIIIISDWDKDDDERHEQQLFCHMECLKDKVSTSTPLYIADLID